MSKSPRGLHPGVQTDRCLIVSWQNQYVRHKDAKLAPCALRLDNSSLATPLGLLDLGVNSAQLSLHKLVAQHCSRGGLSTNG